METPQERVKSLNNKDIRRCSGVLIVNFTDISHDVLLFYFFFLTLKKTLKKYKKEGESNHKFMSTLFINHEVINSYPANICSKSTIETLENGMKYFES